MEQAHSDSATDTPAYSQPSAWIHAIESNTEISCIHLSDICPRKPRSMLFDAAKPEPSVPIQGKPLI